MEETKFYHALKIDNDPLHDEVPDRCDPYPRGESLHP